MDCIVKFVLDKIEFLVGPIQYLFVNDGGGEGFFFTLC